MSFFRKPSRNILRLALYEIRDRPDIPASVSVNEAVEMAKKYSTEESGKFVNGILGTYLRAHPRTKGASGSAGVPARTGGIEDIVSGEVQ